MNLESADENIIDAFLDERDAAGFLVVKYLAEVDVDITNYPALNAYPHLVDKVNRVLMTLGSPGYYEIDRLVPPLSEIINSANNDSDLRYSDYGYLPMITGTNFVNVTNAIDIMLKMGLEPTFPDRSGKYFHERFTNITPTQWRTILIVFNYPLCPESFPTPPQYATLDVLVNQIYYFRFPYPGLIITAEELENKLNTEINCVNFNLNSLYINEIYDLTQIPEYVAANPIQSQQIKIIYQVNALKWRLIQDRLNKYLAGTPLRLETVSGFRT